MESTSVAQVTGRRRGMESGWGVGGNGGGVGDPRNGLGAVAQFLAQYVAQLDAWTLRESGTRAWCCP